MQHSRIGCAVLAGWLLATVALAHECWLPPGSGRVAVGPAATVQQQTCLQDNLSKTLTFSTTIRRLRPTAGSLDSCLLTVTIGDKLHRRPPQAIRFTATHLFSTAYSNCGAVRSYSSGQNQQVAVEDNDYGDLVVADFNFDGRDDFATKLDSGGNGGPLYSFYLQKPSGQFELSTFLTEEMQFFP
ncbi:MAG: hypothetical protein EOO57_14255, partial [Hymenobacter sp.]